jgi:hypothetical protein
VQIRGFHIVVKGNRAEHITEISDGAGLHTGFSQMSNERFDLDCALQKAIIGMQMQVNKIFRFILYIHI